MGASETPLGFVEVLYSGMLFFTRQRLVDCCIQLADEERATGLYNSQGSSYAIAIERQARWMLTVEPLNIRPV